MSSQTTFVDLRPFTIGRRTSLLVDAINLLIILIPAIFVSTVNLWVAYDDAFITYRYAYNFASGRGFVYNIGEWYISSSVGHFSPSRAKNDLQRDRNLWFA